MKKYLFLFSLVFIQTMFAQEKHVLLFPKGAPGEHFQMVEKTATDGKRVAEQTVLRMTNVSAPEISIYTPNRDCPCITDAAVIVCPGGGYNILSYDLEGTEICEWLNSLGITAVLLKYRVPRRKGLPKHAAPLQDVQRALRYVRANATDLKLDTDKIGVMGFSAGGHLSVMASTSYDTDHYAPMDQIDKVSSKPNFTLLVYPAYLSAENFAIAPEIKITSDTPPTLLIHAEDDKKYINSSLFYYYALKEKGVPATMHLYSKGGHGYGMRQTSAPVSEWTERAAAWFRELGISE